MEQALAKLDTTLTERIAVPLFLLKDDYTGVAGADPSDPSCQLDYRLMGTSWIGPWGSVVPWMLPPTSQEGKTVTLRLPQSRVRHFIGDASLYAKLENTGDKPRLVRAVLRLGPTRIIQSFDSEFACRVAVLFKHGGRVADHALYERSVKLACPLFFNIPLQVLPLFVPNSPLPEIEYELSIPVKTAHFIGEFFSSPGEADIPPHSAPETPLPNASKTIVQHVPSLTTFRSSSIENGTIRVDISMDPGKLARALYIRIYNETNSDIPDAISTIEAFGPPPRSVSLNGMAWPGSVCRTHFKKRFGKPEAPYYVFPFSVSPSGHNADYGVVLSEGSHVIIVLNPEISEGVSAEVCVETFERVVWKR